MVEHDPTTPLSKASSLQLDATHVIDYGRSRQPFSPLGPAPLNKRPSSQPVSRVTPSPITMSDTSKIFTPPPTPPSLKPGQKGALTDVHLETWRGMDPAVNCVPGDFTDEEIAKVNLNLDNDFQPEMPPWNETVPRAYTKRYEILGSASSGFQEYGRGVWSVVYRAMEESNPPQSTLLTPPTSPAYNRAQAGVAGILAVKAPCRRDAREILRREARILTFLHQFPCSAKYLVPFHGFDHSRNSIILSAIPLNLEKYAKAEAEHARLNFSTKTMCDPVIGTKNWVQLSSHLIDGLVFLHSRNCVHGDIKPANILLHDSGAEFFTPLFCDFSSSSIQSSPSPLSSAFSQSANEPEGISAVTPDYTSPELLDALHHHTNLTRATANPASDVFALAATLIVAAIGGSPYASARIEVQKLSMAKEGKPLDFARGGENSSRIMKGRLVDKVLQWGVKKDVDQRPSADEWRTIANEVWDEWRISKVERMEDHV